MIKCTALFQYVSNISQNAQAITHTGGWSESIYYDGNSSAASAAFLDWCELRARLLPKGSAIIGQRFQVVNGGSSTLGRKFPGSPSYAADIPQAALQLTAQSGNAVNTRRWSYRGIPDAQITEGEYLPDTTFKTALLVAAGFTTGGAWRFRGRVLDFGFYQFNTIDVDGTIHFIAGVPMVAGDKIRMVRVRDDHGNSITGTYTIVSWTDEETMKLGNWVGRKAVTGEVQQATFNFFDIDGATLSADRIVSRKIGRPFAGYRGRRSSQR